MRYVSKSIPRKDLLVHIRGCIDGIYLTLEFPNTITFQIVEMSGIVLLVYLTGFAGKKKGDVSCLSENQ